MKWHTSASHELHQNLPGREGVWLQTNQFTITNTYQISVEIQVETDYA